jgi:uncharacterized protein YegP (UPF0339 family)
MFIMVYPDSNAEWRWGLHAGDGREILRAPFGHRNKADCVADAQSFRRTVAVAPIIDQEQNSDLAHRGGRIVYDR